MATNLIRPTKKSSVLTKICCFFCIPFNYSYEGFFGMTPEKFTQEPFKLTIYDTFTGVEVRTGIKYEIVFDL